MSDEVMTADGRFPGVNELWGKQERFGYLGINALSVQDSQRAWARVNFPSPSVLMLLSETNATSVHFVLVRDFSYRKAARFACLLPASLLSIPSASTGVPWDPQVKHIG